MNRKAEPGPRGRRVRGREARREATHGKPGPCYDQQVQGLDLFFFLNKVYFWYGKKYITQNSPCLVVLSVQFSDMSYIHNVVQPTTIISFQNLKKSPQTETMTIKQKLPSSTFPQPLVPSNLVFVSMNWPI